MYSCSIACRRRRVEHAHRAFAARRDTQAAARALPVTGRTTSSALGAGTRDAVPVNNLRFPSAALSQALRGGLASGPEAGRRTP
jgi:hypothetical protein